MHEPATARIQHAPSTRGSATTALSRGHDARTTPRNRRPIPRSLGALGLALGLALLAYGLARGQWLTAVIGLLGLVTVERTLLPIPRQLFRRQRRTGLAPASAPEPKVAAALAQDPDNLLALHQVAGPFGELAHVIIRRNGAMIVIDTHAQPGRVAETHGRLLLNGRPFERDIVDQVRRNAMWLKDELRTQLELRVFVHACLVFSQAYVTVRKPVRGVEVANASYLPRWLARLPADRRLQEAVQRDPDRIRQILSKGASR
jgi:hypothetical protein